jgi:Photosynthesis system II assembly factor YCF48
MPELPNLLRQRLALAEPADSHPDADTLNAYAEKLLPAPERGRILQHIALCSQCREVIALTLEASPIEANTTAIPVTPSLPRARRAWAPLFGLAASFAAMAIVAVLIVKQPQKDHRAPVQSFVQAKLDAPEATPSMAPAGEALSPTTPAASSSRPASDKEPVPRARHAQTRGDVAGARMADQEAATPAPPVVVSSNTASVEAITASVAVSPRRAYLNDNLFRPGDRGQNAVDAADGPNSQGSRGGSAQFPNGFAGNVQLGSNADLPVPAPGSKPVWTASPSTGHGVTFLSPFKQAARRIVLPPISALGLTAKAMGGSDGQFNPAKDLQSVEVSSAKRKETAELDQTQAFTAPAMRSKAAASTAGHLPPSWAVGNGKLLRTDESGAWVSGYTGTENIDFTAVTAHGADVWAGGNHAALLHSRDGGATWERLRLGLSATGNVTSILANGQSIQVTTSENQTWSSEDSGKSWIQN